MLVCAGVQRLGLDRRAVPGVEVCRRLAAGVLPNTPENLARWLREPQAVKPGNLMKLPRQLTEDEISALVAYLRAHQ